MKFLRWAAVVALCLMSLLNIGVVADSPPAAAIVGAVALGLFGFVAAYGLARRESWGRATGIVAGVLNIVGGVIAMANDADGAVVGIVLGALIVVFTFAASDSTPARSGSALG